jgi:hypothetical protein
MSWLKKIGSNTDLEVDRVVQFVLNGRFSVMEAQANLKQIAAPDVCPSLTRKIQQLQALDPSHMNMGLILSLRQEVCGGVSTSDNTHVDMAAQDRSGNQNMTEPNYEEPEIV